MKRNNIFSKIAPLLLACIVGDATLQLLYAPKRRRHHQVALSRGTVRRINPVVPVSQTREILEHQIMKRQLQDFATMPAHIRAERLPLLLERLNTIPSVKVQDPLLEGQIRQALRKAQEEIRPPKGAIVVEKEVAGPKVVENQGKAPENAEQVTTYVESLIKEATGLPKTASVFEQLGSPCKKADEVWLAHREDPLEKLIKVTSLHFHLSKTLDALGQKYFSEKKDAQEIMQVFKEQDEQKARTLLTYEISYWLLFDLLQNYENIDAKTLKEGMLQRSNALFTFAFNLTKIELLSHGKLEKVGAQLIKITGREKCQKFLKTHPQPQGVNPVRWFIQQKDTFIKDLPADQQELVAPLLAEGAQLIEQITAVQKENEQAIDALKQTGYFQVEEAGEQNVEVPTPPQPQKKGMSLGTKIAIGLMGAAILGGGYMVYKEYTKQGDGDKSVSGAAKSAGEGFLKQFSSTIDGIKGLFGRATKIVKDKFGGKKQEGQ